MRGIDSSKFVQWYLIACLQYITVLPALYADKNDARALWSRLEALHTEPKPNIFFKRGSMSELPQTSQHEQYFSCGALKETPFTQKSGSGLLGS